MLFYQLPIYLLFFQNSSVKLVFCFGYTVYTNLPIVCVLEGVCFVLLAFPFRQKHLNTVTAAIIASAVEVNFLRLG